MICDLCLGPPPRSSNLRVGELITAELNRSRTAIPMSMSLVTGKTHVIESHSMENRKKKKSTVETWFGSVVTFIQLGDSFGNWRLGTGNWDLDLGYLSFDCLGP